MAGMNRRTGKALSDWAHVVQSVEDILTTPKLTRVWRREYGGKGTYLQDKPGTPDTLITFTNVLGEAIDRWEPRYRLRRVWFEEAGNDGEFLLNVDGVYYPKGHLGDFETGVERGVELPLPKGYYVTGAPYA